MTERTTNRNFSVYPADLDTLNAVAAKFNGSGRRNLSQALRFIISEWQKQQEGNYDATKPGDCTAVAV